MEKYLYVQGFCKETHYTGLQPVAYEKEEQGVYTKKYMACVGSGDCELKDKCDLLVTAPEVIEPENEWKLRDIMKGTKE